MNKIKFTKKYKEIFDKLGVKIIYLYGSVAEGHANKMSDVDLGVVFDNPGKYQNKIMDAYGELHRIFGEIFPGKDLDVVFLQHTPIDLQFRAIKNGRVIYEQKAEDKMSYQENIFKRCCDFKYFFDLQYQAVFQRI